MKNKVIPLLAVLLLCGCANNHSSNTESFFSNTESSFINQSINTDNSFISSSYATSDSQKEDENNSFSLDKAYELLNRASNADEDFSSITVQQYYIREKYYQKQEYKMTSYSNDITIYSGTTTYTEYTDYDKKKVSNFKEQRMYKDGKYSQIRKFDDVFVNSASIEECDETTALVKLNIGKSLTAQEMLKSFAENYTNDAFNGEIDEQGNMHGVYLYFSDTISDNGYVFIAALEFTLDKTYHMKDLYYTEGYFDAYFCDDIESVRKHGPVSYEGDGYTFSIVRSEQNQKSDYAKDLPFALEDNFITSLSFNVNELTVSISEITDNYISLLEYLTANVVIGETKGAPINNLYFTSSNTSVATIGSSYYADFVGVGETLIDAYDTTYNVKATNTLKLILTE